MGSYGLGLSRILAASVEVLSNEQEMRWPEILAPYTVLILPPKVSLSSNIKSTPFIHKITKCEHTGYRVSHF